MLLALRIRISTHLFNDKAFVKTVFSFKQQKRSLHISSEGGRASVSGVIATVFGSTGFLGRYVVNQLGRMGSQIIIPYRGEEKSYNHMKLMGDLGQIVPLKWDIRDKESIRQAVKHSNVIINLVGKHYDTRNFTMYDVHVEGAKRIAEVAKELRVERFIHVSALGANTSSPSEWLKTKAEGEAAVRSIFPEVTIIRPAIYFGAQDEFLNNHATLLRYWPFYPLIHGDKQIQPIWVNDVATAILNSLKIPDSAGKIYEVGGPNIYTMRQVVEWMRMVLKLNSRIIEVGDETAWHLGYWLGQHRKPRFTLDYVKNTANILTSGNFPGTKELHVDPIPLTSHLAIGYFRSYRRPSRMMDLTLEQEEIPGIEPGKPSPF